MATVVESIRDTNSVQRMADSKERMKEIKLKEDLLVQLLETHKQFDKLSKQLLFTLAPESTTVVSTKRAVDDETELDSEIARKKMKANHAEVEESIEAGTSGYLGEKFLALLRIFRAVLDDCKDIDNALTMNDQSLTMNDHSSSETELDSVDETNSQV